MGRYEKYRDVRGEYRWRFVSRNGNIISVSSEGYKTKRARDNAIRIVKESGSAEELDLDSE